MEETEVGLPIPQLSLGTQGQGCTSSIFNISNNGLTGLETGFPCGAQAGLEVYAQMVLLPQPPEYLGVEGTGHTT